MQESTSQLLALIRKELAPLQAKMDLLQAEVDRLERLVSTLEQRVDELESDSDDEIEGIHNVDEQEIDDSLLDHLLGEASQKPGVSKNATHISLTIDLSKKDSLK